MIPEDEIHFTEPNTLIRMMYEAKSGTLLIKLHDMSGEITKKQMKNAMDTFIKRLTRKQLYGATPTKLSKMFRQAMIVELVTEWLESK